MRLSIGALAASGSCKNLTAPLIASSRAMVRGDLRVQPVAYHYHQQHQQYQL